jgi:signal transduction histidine kinase
MQALTHTRTNWPQIRGSVAEFFMALRNPFTYSIVRNHDVAFGLLWGLPIPVFALLIHAYASGQPLTPASLLNIAMSHPFHLVFIFHPLLFAVVFGALGTMRAIREARIESLLSDVRTHCDELARANSKLKELDRMKSEFLANVTHELKSPLVTALGYTDRILGQHLGPISDKQRKGLDVSKRNLIRLRKLIEEILDFSRLESGMARFNMQPATLNAAIWSAVENAALKVKDRNVTISVECPSTVANVHGDAAKLLQVVMNLLDNAIKFSPDGSGIRIALEPMGDKWRLSVIDKGCGIAPDKIPQLFERFFQVDGSLGRLYDGVGLGLVVVKKIVEAHHGRIWVDSKIGPESGTAFHIEFPAASPVAAQNSDTHEQNIEKEVAHATHSSN